jgi:type III pantothenate kinase
MNNRWLALMIGNSRLHWALFADRQILHVWHCPLSEFKGFPPKSSQDWAEWQSFLPPFQSDTSACYLYPPYPELWLASVVPAQSEFWRTYPNLNVLQLSDVPLQQIYAGLGLDRAIALWGAGIAYGWPCLAIDGGTALTLTGADASATLAGGAIFPGLALQLRALASSTAALGLIELPQDLPTLWGKDTVTAIQSGVVHTVIASIVHFIQQWSQTYPASKIILTGGDAEQLSIYIERWVLQYEVRIQALNCLITDPIVIFKGMQALRSIRLNEP